MSMEIKSESEYQAVLKRLDVVFMADQSTPEGKEAAALVDAIEAYEDIHHPIGPPSNVPLIESIISRAGNTLKLRFQDGSVGLFDTEGFIPPRQFETARVGGGQLGYTEWREDPYHMPPIGVGLDPIVVWNNTKFL